MRLDRSISRSPTVTAGDRRRTVLPAGSRAGPQGNRHRRYAHCGQVFGQSGHRAGSHPCGDVLPPGRRSGNRPRRLLLVRHRATFSPHRCKHGTPIRRHRLPGCPAVHPVRDRRRGREQHDRRTRIGGAPVADCHHRPRDRRVSRSTQSWTTLPTSTRPCSTSTATINPRPASETWSTWS